MKALETNKKLRLRLSEGRNQFRRGGAYEIRTRVQGFADPCLTPRPTRQIPFQSTTYHQG